ncbi:hypothetical protein BD414DRAFT_315986 [Trametes punicea]|nr:hypothetical protein BD414DRAFT_315986 [Trametes punicea]
MSLADNNASTAAPISHTASSARLSFARTSGALSFPYPPLAPRRAMHPLPFVPRPFPPPALAGVPLEYIIDQLRRLAPHYWSRPETSDCTIVIPLDMAPKTSGPTVDCDAFRRMGISSAMSLEPFGSEEGTDSAAPDFARKPLRPRRMIMKLHMDYLCAHSSLFRGLLSGASAFDIAAEIPPSGSGTSCVSSPGLSRQPSTSSLRLPCILPSSTCTHPVVHLPIPDPVSFHHLIHYIYFGSTSFIEEALDNGELSWEGLARNVEYLQMGAEIKFFLGRYWRRAHTYYDCSGSERDYDSEYDSDSDAFMTDEDESTLADPDEDRMCMADDEDEDGISMLKAKAQARARDPPRGRQRTTRRLGHSMSDPVISHRAAEAGPSTVHRNSSK